MAKSLTHYDFSRRLRRSLGILNIGTEMDINTCRLLFGYLVSTLGGALVLWVIIDKYLWPKIAIAHNIKGKEKKSLSVWLGILERASYTTAS